MSYETVIWEQDGGVGRLTLNRPDSLNAWIAAARAELKQIVEVDAADPSVRAVLVTGRRSRLLLRGRSQGGLRR